MPADSNPRSVNALVKVASIVVSARTSMTVSASFVGRTGNCPHSAQCRWMSADAGESLGQL